MKQRVSVVVCFLLGACGVGLASLSGRDDAITPFESGVLFATKESEARAVVALRNHWSPLSSVSEWTRVHAILETSTVSLDLKRRILRMALETADANITARVLDYCKQSVVRIADSVPGKRDSMATVCVQELFQQAVVADWLAWKTHRPEVLGALEQAASLDSSPLDDGKPIVGIFESGVLTDQEVGGVIYRLVQKCPLGMCGVSVSKWGTSVDATALLRLVEESMAVNGQPLSWSASSFLAECGNVGVRPLLETYKKRLVLPQDRSAMEQVELLLWKAPFANDSPKLLSALRSATGLEGLAKVPWMLKQCNARSVSRDAVRDALGDLRRAMNSDANGAKGGQKQSQVYVGILKRAAVASGHLSESEWR